jgi:hypothetical protein
MNIKSRSASPEIRPKNIDGYLSPDGKDELPEVLDLEKGTPTGNEFDFPNLLDNDQQNSLLCDDNLKIKYEAEFPEMAEEPVFIKPVMLTMEPRSSYYW